MTDEVAFARNGTVNSQNTHFWSENRPGGNIFEKSIRKENLFVPGVCGNECIIGPFFYGGTLTGIRYEEMFDDRIYHQLEKHMEI